MTSAEIFSTICRVTGQMALHQSAQRRVTRQMILDWADALERAARELRRMVQ